MSICMDHIHGAGAYTIHQYHTHVLNDRNLYEKITKIHEKTNTSRWQATNEQILSIFYSIFCLLFFFKQIFFRKEYKDRDEQSKCWRMYIWRKTKNWRKQCDMVVVCMSSCRYYEHYMSQWRGYMFYGQECIGIWMCREELSTREVATTG